MKKQGRSKGEVRNKSKKGEKDPAIAALGNRIKEIRRKQGYTSLYDFAYEHEISRGQYARFEQGANMTFINFMKVAKAFGITLSELFEGIENSLQTGKTTSDKRAKK